MTNAEVTAMLAKLREHYGEPVLPVSRYCDALRTWLTVTGRSQTVDVQRLLLAIDKSALLDRLIYQGQKLRSRKCPEHKGVWQGLEFPFPDSYRCPHGCQMTGWIPEPEDGGPPFSARDDSRKDGAT